MIIGRKPAPPWLEIKWLLGQFGRNRDQAGAYRFGGDIMQQIADAFGVYYASVSRAVHAAGRALQVDAIMLDCKTWPRLSWRGFPRADTVPLNQSASD